MLNYRRTKRRQSQHAETGAGCGDAQGARAPPIEPAADDSEGWDVGAGGTDAHAEPVSEVGDVDVRHQGGGRQTTCHGKCSKPRDDTRAKPISDRSGHWAQEVERGARDSIERRGCRPARSEVKHDRLEEYTEAV